MGGSGGSVNAIKYYHVGAQRIALRDSAGLKYIHSDHLGSTALTASSNGSYSSEVRYAEHPGA